MNGRAIIVRGVGGRAELIDNVSAKAHGLPLISAEGDANPQPIGDGRYTSEPGLMHWMNVKPEETQHFVWLTPVVGIDYNIETSTRLHWKII